MSDLYQYFTHNPGRLIHKWDHYFDVYERHFSRFRNSEVVILEIGISQGGSLQMWKNYFGEKATIYGIDVNPQCKQFEEENIKIFIGSQADRQFLNELKKQIPLIDILIDDGGHTMEQQIVTFESLFSHVKPNGVYLVEDLHTSYWLRYGGGHKRKGTFIEYSKNFIDLINAYHSEQKGLKVDSFTRSVDSLHFYDSMLVIEKQPRKEPFHLKTGVPSYSVENAKRSGFVKKRVDSIIKATNLVLRYFKLPGVIWK